MVQTLAPNCTDDPLDIRTLLRRPWRSQHFLNPQFLHLLREARTEDSVTVSQPETRCAVPRECLPQLLRGPFRSRMSRHAEMENPPTIVRQDQEYVQHLKANGWHREEVDRYHGLDDGPDSSPWKSLILRIQRGSAPFRQSPVPRPDTPSADPESLGVYSAGPDRSRASDPP